ncbi:MAG: sulfotransferase [Woeseiaceae bacterium]|nr:sulfotransferase [Woeseiaceae bacterium]
MNRATDVPAAAWMQDTLRQGFELLAAGRLDEAGECCRRLLGAKPDLVEAHFLVGLIALEMRQSGTALQAFGSVTKLDPKHGAAYAHLAKLFASAGQPLRADAALQRAIEHEDGNPVVQDLIGTIYQALGDQAEALEWYGRALQQRPKHVPFLVNHANCLVYLGRLAEAETELERALSQQPSNPNAHWIRSGLRKAKDRSHAIELEKLLEKDWGNPQSVAFLSYALGKQLEDLEDWDNAFAAFRRGGDARRTVVDFDEAEETAMYELLRARYTRDWLESRPEGWDDASPIFVVGQPRTGTTLVERIIAAHSAVHSAGELRQFGTAVRRHIDYREPKRFSARLFELALDADPLRVGEGYMVTSQKMRGDKPRFVDKLPSNFLYLPLILAALPKAKIVHLRRHPMDACFSSYKQLFADAYPHSYKLDEMARHHARYYHLMACWRERFGDRFFEVAYEDVARDVEPNARALIDFLELPWEDACLEFHKQKGAVATASAVQVRQPAHTRSIGRWKRYEKHLEPMRRELEKAGVPVDD